MKFKKIVLPDEKETYIPDDIELAFPKTSLPDNLVHYLAYIPWDDKYLHFVPDSYKDFFKFVLPHLHARTTDVHTAICLPLLAELLTRSEQKLNERIIYVALILHDSGWSQLSEQEIADSLSYSGLALSQAAKAPKNKHAELGSELSKRILEQFKFSPALDETEKSEICKMVLYHDVTKEVIDMGVVTPELFLVSDSDRLWSYTHENFWQDTVRKGATPEEYVGNLSRELEGYFYTKEGKELAKNLLEKRRAEVDQYPSD